MKKNPKLITTQDVFSVSRPSGDAPNDPNNPNNPGNGGASTTVSIPAYTLLSGATRVQTLTFADRIDACYIPFLPTNGGVRSLIHLKFLDTPEYNVSLQIRYSMLDRVANEIYLTQDFSVGLNGLEEIFLEGRIGNLGLSSYDLVAGWQINILSDIDALLLVMPLFTVVTTESLGYGVTIVEGDMVLP